MYTLITSYVKHKTPRAQWVKIDLTNTLTTDIRQNYQSCILELSTPYTALNIFVDTNSLITPFNFGLIEISLYSFLTNVENKTLPTIEFKIPIKKQVKWFDPLYHGYEVELTDIKQHYTNQIRSGQANDLYIKKDNIDPRELFDYTLFTVNGLIHRSSFNGEVVNIVGGGYTCKKTNMNLIGATYFGDIGKIKQVNIGEEGIRNSLTGEPLIDKTYIKIPKNYDLTNKSVMLSVAGFLIIPDDRLFKRVGENLYMLDFKNQPWLKRLQRLKDSFFMTWLNKVLSVNNLDRSIVSLEEFYSDESIKNILTLNNTFFIIVDTPNLDYEKIDLEFNELPGSYVYHKNPTLPLMTGVGTLSEYHYKKEYDRYSIKVVDSLLPNYQFETREIDKSELVNDNRVTNNPFEYSKGYFLNIYTQG